MELKNKVALVTGASRGVGKGIAISLAKAGALVYITGRTLSNEIATLKLPGSLTQTQKEIESFGGKCRVLQCDHNDDRQVADTIAAIHREHSHIDILVNNVWGGYEHFSDGTEFWSETGFWDAPLSRFDSMFQTGVRANYVVTHLVAPKMVANKTGLIVNISFYAAELDDQGVAYSASKAATNRMSSSMALELKPYDISVVTLYPGLVRTESVLAAQKAFDLTNSESPEFVGRAIVALAQDDARLAKTGKILTTAQLAQEYGFTDIDGTCPEPSILT